MRPDTRRIRVDFTAEPEQQAVADVVESILVRENTWPALVSGASQRWACRYDWEETG